MNIAERIQQESIDNFTCKATEVSLLKLHSLMGSLTFVANRVSYLCAKYTNQESRIYSREMNCVVKKDQYCDLTEALRIFLTETYICQVDKMVFQHVLELTCEG